MKPYLFFGLSILLAVGLAACGGRGGGARAGERWERSQVRPATDTAALISMLRAEGARVERIGAAEQPFLSASGTMIDLAGGHVQIFEYSGIDDMEKEAAVISPDGSTVGTSRIRWIGSPHFFKQGRVLVLYVGDDAKVLKLLEAALGRQFAGR